MRHRGRKPDTPRLRCQGRQTRQSERQLVAPFGAGHRVDFVDDDRLQMAEKHRGLRLGQQHGQAFRRGQQDIRRRLALLPAFFGRRVAGARFDADRQVHVLHRRLQVARDIGRQRLQRADIDCVQICGLSRPC